MKTYHFADAKTGIFGGRKLCLSDDSGEQLQANTPAGTIPVAGVADWQSQRVDLGTGLLVDYVPPQPSSDHEWHSDRKRWVLRAEVQQARQKRDNALAEIRRLETEVQPRAQRELLLDPADPEPRSRLAAIEQRIAALRPPRFRDTP
jgi:hypothetical protein